MHHGSNVFNKSYSLLMRIQSLYVFHHVIHTITILSFVDSSLLDPSPNHQPSLWPLYTTQPAACSNSIRLGFRQPCVFDMICVEVFKKLHEALRLLAAQL